MLMNEELIRRCCAKVNGSRALSYVNNLTDERTRRIQRNKLMKVAIILGKVDLVQQMINDGLSEDDICNRESSMVHLACYMGDMAIAELLLDRISDLNVADRKGNIALHWASAKGYVEIAEMLIRRGMNIDIKNEEGETPVSIAVLNRNSAMVKLLIDSGADINLRYKGNKTLLHIAAYIEYYDILEYIIKKGADINAVDKNGLTVLHALCYKDNKDMIKLCLDNGAFVNAKDNRGFTPLCLVCTKNNFDIADMLYKNGAYLDEKTSDGLTILHRMVLENNIPMAKFLIERGADLNQKSSDGLSVLHMACKFNNINLVNLLLQHGAIVNIKSSDDRTPLHIATAFSFEGIVDILLKNEADVSIRTKDNITALHLACENNMLALIKTLIGLGVPLDVQTNLRGDTALHIMCRKGNKKGIKALLDGGADVDIQNFDGETPLDVLYDNNLSDIACMVANKASVISDVVVNWAIEEENIELLKILLLREGNPDRIVKKLVLKDQKETLREILKELRIRDMDLSIRKKVTDPSISDPGGVSLLGIAILNNNIQISKMLIDYNSGRRGKRARKLSDILHNEDANEFLKNPSNSAKKSIKKIKIDSEEKIMNELKDENISEYNKYKFGLDDKISVTAQKGVCMLPPLK